MAQGFGEEARDGIPASGQVDHILEAVWHSGRVMYRYAATAAVIIP